MRRAGGIVMDKMGDNIRGKREILFELTRIGNAVKVTAVDAATGVEASIVGAPTMGEEMLKRNALRKLDYVLKRRDAG
jgi:hypothetical protein